MSSLSQTPTPELPAKRHKKKPKLLFVVTEDWYFCSHRLPLAKEAIKQGFEVAIATRVAEHGEMIEAAGIKIYPWHVIRGSTNLWHEFVALMSLLKIYLSFRPTLVHQVALKSVLYGGFITMLVGPNKVVNAIGGMGSVFNEGKYSIKWLQFAILSIFKWLISGEHKVLILQNPDDRELLIRYADLNPKLITLIRGAGVNVDQFDVVPEPQTDVPMIILPARMLWDKGVGEFVEAAKQLKAEGITARFVLVGGTDEANPSRIPLEQLTAWVETGAVEWLGLRNDMPDLIKQSNIVCLPSYREGLPKALLEAAASGRAIVTTDVPGCREVVRDSENGLLVPASDAIALAKALKMLIENPDIRAEMGAIGRQMVLNEFSEQVVVESTMSIYKRLLAA